ncbi:hypothetical protein DN53_04455 [Flagellimonas olearia]|uniref:Uncharacterized protein n=1 Tax=Flagellimonas olearia TaxID=552546 RepID=A0A444VS17_9FLAO|nr:hypothetical protein DN53_04455 [Allomuricauda olearia]
MYFMNSNIFFVFVVQGKAKSWDCNYVIYITFAGNHINNRSGFKLTFHRARKVRLCKIKEKEIN